MACYTIGVNMRHVLINFSKTLLCFRNPTALKYHNLQNHPPLGISNPGYSQGRYVYLFTCVCVMKADGAMILTIINHYILITRGFFHVSTRRCSGNELPCHLPEMFKARDKQTLIRSVPFKEEQPCKNTRGRFPLGVRAIWCYCAVYIREEMSLITAAHPSSAQFLLRSK